MLTDGPSQLTGTTGSDQHGSLLPSLCSTGGRTPSFQQMEGYNEEVCKAHYVVLLKVQRFSEHVGYFSARMVDVTQGQLCTSVVKTFGCLCCRCTWRRTIGHFTGGQTPPLTQGFGEFNLGEHDATYLSPQGATNP